jgi:pimeloyl-ACP methyl ester carboxylesterase
MLVALSSNFDVYGIELPGTGQSDAPPKHWSFHDFTPLIDAVFAYYRVEKGMVLGHSLGWVSALKFARYFPQRVSHLIISNGPILFRIRFWGSDVIFSFGFLLLTVLIAWPCRLFSKVIPVSLLRRLGGQYPYLTRSRGIMRKILRIIIDDDTIEDARNVKVPTLVIGSGKGGIFIPLRNSLDLHKAIPGSDLVVIPNAPHDFKGVWAQKFSEVVRDWIMSKKLQSSKN